MQFFALANLIISFQAFFLALHFAFKKKGDSVLNFLIFACTLAFGVISVNTYMSLSPIIGEIGVVQDIANYVMWVIAPSLYLYVIGHQRQVTKNEVMYHLVPYLPLTLFDLITDFEWFESFIMVIAFGQMLIYLTMGIVIALKRYASYRTFYSWILPVLIVYAFLVILNVIFKTFNSIGVFEVSQDLIQTFTVLLSFPVLYTSYREMNTNKIGLTNKKYSGSKLKETRSNEVLNEVKRFIEGEETFKNREMSLRMVAEHTGQTTKTISQVVNQELGITFTDYITSLRIERAKSYLKNPEMEYLSIAGIAEESGFTSVSRFNHLFKKHTGITPKAFKKASEEVK